MSDRAQHRTVAADDDDGFGRLADARGERRGELLGFGLLAVEEEPRPTGTVGIG